MKLLILADTPTCSSGFGRVCRALASRWTEFESIDIWGVNYSGWPFWHEGALLSHDFKTPPDIYPAGYGDWSTGAKLQAFLQRLQAGKHTHLWMMQDTFGLCMHSLPAAIKELTGRGLKSFLYFPVDAPMKPEWSAMVDAVGTAVAYTEYGRQEALKSLEAAGLQPREILIMAHGSDFKEFKPLKENVEGLTEPQRIAVKRIRLRKDWFGDWLKPNDFVMVNVNKNQPRKGVVNSLEILKKLKAMNLPRRVRLIMHMENIDVHDGNHQLEWMGQQLGLVHGGDWCHTDGTGEKRTFVNGHPLIKDVGLNELYNLSNLYLTTTLGEGWGLPITEALAAGCPVAAPAHTSCQEILDAIMRMGAQTPPCIVLPLSESGVLSTDDTRIRWPVDTTEAAIRIKEFIEMTGGVDGDQRVVLNDELKEWLSWDRIAAEWMKLFKR